MSNGHADLSQLTPRMLGALSNVQTKVIFGVGRQDAEYFAKLVGRMDTEAVKRDPKTETQHEVFAPLPEQWERWVDQLRFQSPRQAMVAGQGGDVRSIKTITIPPYEAVDEAVEEVRRESLKRHGIPYSKAMGNMEGHGHSDGNEPEITAYGW